MDLNFTKVTYDGDLSEFSEDDLRQLISEFENAQESNVAEFNQAADKLDEVEEIDYEEYEDARSALIGEITEADAFEDVPITEDELDAADFGKVRDWHNFVASADTDTDDDTETDFDDVGKDAPLDDGGDDEPEFDDRAVEIIDGMSGVNVQTE